MSIALATLRDPQSAEHLKSVALAEPNAPRRRAMLDEAVALDAENSTLVGHLALAHNEAGEPAKAVSLLTDAFVRWPRQIHLANLLGVALFQLGHSREALQLFEHCLGLDPDYPPARESAGNARRRLAAARPAAASVRSAIAQGLERAAHLPRPTLAVCLIVKDEEEFLADALSSVKGLADEVIVVDTGSTDATVEIARQAGARVAFFPWVGDFSAARNAALDLATSDWVLSLDADERVRPESVTTVRAVMEEFRGTERVICPKIRNFTRDGRHLNDGFSGRLFPNTPGFRWSGRVHEQVAADRPEVATDYRLDICLDHLGADPEVMREKDKDARNVALLEARLVEAPDDLMTWFYLGSQHWVAPRRAEAREAFERVVDLYDRNPSQFGMAVRHVTVPYSYVGLVRAALDAGEHDAALAFAERGLSRFPDIPDLWFFGAFAHLGRGALDTAQIWLERAESVPVAGYSIIAMRDEAIQRYRARKFIGDIHFEQGRPAQALAAYEAVVPHLTEREDRLVVGARRVELASELERWDLLPAAARDYLALRPENGELAAQVAAQLGRALGPQAAYDFLTGLWEAIPALRGGLEIPLAIGRIAEEAGEDREAFRWYEHLVAADHPDPAFWLNLARLLLRLEERESAAQAFAVAKGLLSRGAG